jgi:hypothetical protein
MVGFSRRTRIAVRLFLLLLTGAIAPGVALAAPSTTSAVPITHFVVVQPVDVCTNGGTSCVIINNNSQTVLSAAYNCVANGVNTLCANLYAGFIDPATGMLAHRNAWSAIGIDFRQTPIVQYNNTASQALKIDTCTGGASGCTSGAFSTLIQQPGIANGTTAPTFPRNASPTTLNAFFVKNICSTAITTSCTTTTRGDVDGLGALNGNGMAIATLAFVPATGGHPDSFAHELGHNFAWDHTTFGAVGATNLMTAGGSRTIPGPTVTTASTPNAAWVREVSPNNASPTATFPALDLLTTGGTCTSINPLDSSYATCTQQTAALLSGFLHATPAASALVCPSFGCGDASTPTAAAARPTTTTTPPPPLSVDIRADLSGDCYPDYPAVPSSSICANAFLAKVVIVLTKGQFNKNFKFTSCGGPSPCSTASSVLAAPPVITNSNDESEEEDDSRGICPGASCLRLKFLPGAITGTNFGFLDFTIGARIGTTPADPSQLKGTVCYFWNRATGGRYYSSCSDFSGNFGISSDSQMVNLAINPLIPLNFPGTGEPPCTLIPPSTTCTDPTSSYTQD